MIVEIKVPSPGESITEVEIGSWSHYLLINENGKIIGIETGEH